MMFLLHIFNIFDLTKCSSNIPLRLCWINKLRSNMNIPSSWKYDQLHGNFDLGYVYQRSTDLDENWSWVRFFILLDNLVSALSLSAKLLGTTLGVVDHPTIFDNPRQSMVQQIRFLKIIIFKNITVQWLIFLWERGTCKDFPMQFCMCCFRIKS